MKILTTLIDPRVCAWTSNLHPRTSGEKCKHLTMSDTADQATKDATMKQRVVTHMNCDHQDSLIRYLEHFSSVSSFLARNARLEDITFSSLTIRSSGTNYNIPIKPPMTAWSEVRQRVVALDAEAVAGLGRSSIAVKSYVKPYGSMLVVFAACVITWTSFSRRANFESGSLLYESILRYVPQFANFCWQVQPLVIYPMLVLHTSEATYMAHSRLSKHTVPFGSQLWWTWVCSTFIEGFGSFVRFDAIVKAGEARRANAKH